MVHQTTRAYGAATSGGAIVAAKYNRKRINIYIAWLARGIGVE